VLAMTLPGDKDIAITALNYGHGSTSVQVDLTLVPPGIPAASVAGQTALDIVANSAAGSVSGDGHLNIDLDGLTGRTLVVHRQ
jgi:hypothetical protein